MKQLSRLQKRVERMENALNRGREPQDPVDRFWGAMIGQEEELYKRITELWPFEEALQKLWRAYTLGGQEAADEAWKGLNETQRALWNAQTVLCEHIEHRLKDPDVPEFNPSVWPVEVQKLVLEVER